jgi:antitoxin component YwqK of YwqJK toxin-antitoxin module
MKINISLIISLFIFLNVLAYGQSGSSDSTVIKIDSDTVFRQYEIHYLKKFMPEVKYGLDFPAEGKIVGVTADGITLFRISLMNGHCHGPQEYYFENGNKRLIYSCDSGKYEGAYTEYYPSNNIYIQATFVNGLAEGTFDTFWENGNINLHQYFERDMLISEEAYYEDGKLQGGNQDLQPVDYTYNCLENMKTRYAFYEVKNFSETVRLQLTFDSIQLQGHTIKEPITFKLKIENETELLQLNDSLYIKLILFRNHEYGQKFYSIRFDHFKKGKECMQLIQNGATILMEYNKRAMAGGWGIGSDSDPTFMRFYCTYKLE